MQCSVQVELLVWWERQSWMVTRSPTTAWSGRFAWQRSPNYRL